MQQGNRCLTEVDVGLFGIFVMINSFLKLILAEDISRVLQTFKRLKLILELLDANYSQITG